MKNYVPNEIGTLRKILIHSPDSGIGKIIPSKLKDWLYEDTVHLTKMREEYGEFLMLLLHFIDPEKAKYTFDFVKDEKVPNKETVYNPSEAEYFNSDKVIDVQKALSDVLEDEIIKIRLTSAICAIEGCNQKVQTQLENTPPVKLSRTLITGILVENGEEKFIFPPIPNLVFTRDIGTMLKDHILLSKSATISRKRESLIAKYIAFFHPNLFANSPDKVIEITEESGFFMEDLDTQKENMITIEGGDIMMISPNHLIVGCSERTSKNAVNAIIHIVFSTKSLQIEQISVLQIPSSRAQMHIDTVFTQVKRNAWIIYGGFSEKIEKQRFKGKRSFTSALNGRVQEDSCEGIKVLRFYKEKDQPYSPHEDYFKEELAGLEDLLTKICVNDYGVKETEVKIIYSGNNEFPYCAREQWTDSCNLLAIKEGLVIGYDRNEKTIEAFRDKEKGLGFNIIHAKDLLQQINLGHVSLHDLTDTLILISSSELSRARGGSHCMSMPLFRDKIC